MPDGVVVAVNSSGSHTFSKPSAASIRLLVGLGVEGDAHCGSTVKHRSRVARDPSQPNLRQVHLISSEIHSWLGGLGFSVAPGQMGENVTTSGVDVLGLPLGTLLHLGSSAVVSVTGLRNPCGQLNGLASGLRDALLEHDADGSVVARRAGIMSVVVAGGSVSAGDAIRVELPALPHVALVPI
jgi:MOSC domain-containing protein YiiM